jgi:hypothetical protein
MKRASLILICVFISIHVHSYDSNGKIVGDLNVSLADHNFMLQYTADSYDYYWVPKRFNPAAPWIPIGGGYRDYGTVQIEILIGTTWYSFSENVTVSPTTITFPSIDIAAFRPVLSAGSYEIRIHRRRVKAEFWENKDHEFNFYDANATLTINPAGTLTPGKIEFDSYCYGSTPSQFTVTAPTGGIPYQNDKYLFKWHIYRDYIYIFGTTNDIMTSQTTGIIQYCWGGLPSEEGITAPSGYPYYLGGYIDGVNYTIVQEPGLVASGQHTNLQYTHNFTNNSTVRQVRRTVIDYTGNKATTSILLRPVYYPSGGAIGNANTDYMGHGDVYDTICYNTRPDSIFSMRIASISAFGNTVIPPLTYEWEKSTRPEGSNTWGAWITVSGAVKQSYHPAELTVSTKYRRKVKNPFCNTSNYTENEMIYIVRAKLNGGTIGHNENLCHGQTPSNIIETQEPSGGSGKYLYQWYDATTNFPGTLINGANNKEYQPPASQNTGTTNIVKYYVRQITDEKCEFTYSNLLGKINDEWSVDYINKTFYPAVKPGSVIFAMNTDEKYICYNSLPGTMYNFSNATGGHGTFTYQWQYSEFDNNTWSDWHDIEGATGLQYIGTELLVKTRKYRRVAKNQCEETATETLTVHVYPALQPGAIGDVSVPTQTVCNNKVLSDNYTIINAISPSGGSPTGSSIDEDGTPTNRGEYIYQWYKSIDYGQSWTPIGGATNREYKPDKLQYNTQFKRNVTDSKGCGSLDTDTVAIHVYKPINPGIIEGTQEICNATYPSTLINVDVATGGNGPISYTWQYTTDNGFTWKDANALVTTAEYSPEILTQTTAYRRLAVNECSITDNNGKSTEASNFVLITVKEPIAGGTVGNNQQVCYGEQPYRLNNLSVINANNYQWSKSIDGINWEIIPGATQVSFLPDYLTHTTYFKRIASFSDCGSSESNIVTITVASELNPGEIDSELYVMSEENAPSISGTVATGGSGSYSYQWYQWINEQYMIIPDGTDKDYTPSTIVTEELTYVRRVNDNCSVKESNACTIKPLTVDERTGFTFPEHQIICFGHKPQKIQNTILPAGYYAYWEVSTDGMAWQKAKKSTYLLYYEPEELTETSYYRRAVYPTGHSEYTTYSNVVTVEVLPANAAVTTDVQSGYCLGEPVTINVIPSVGYDYYWYAGNDTIKDRTSFIVPELLRDTIVEVMSVNRQNHCISQPVIQNITVDRITANFSASITDVALGKGAKFTNYSQGASTYEWFFEEGEGSYAKDLIYYFNIPGPKTIKLVATSENGCTAEKVMENYITVSNSENVGGGELPTGVETEENTGLVIYPNPVENVLYIRYENSAPETEEIFDAKGRLIFKLKITANPEAVNVSSLPAGAYILRLTEKDNIKNIKFIKP